MAWSTLSDRYSNMPRILAGPILRKVDANSVSVWVAFKNIDGHNQVTLEIDESIINLTNSTPLISETVSNSDIKQLGTGAGSVCVCLVTAHSASSTPFEEAKTYFYNLKIDGLGLKNILDVNGNMPTNALANPNYGPLDLSYDNSGYPSFSLPPSDLNSLRVIHGSCRKPHGDRKFMGAKHDALPAVDAMIKKAKADAGANLADFACNRPHLLFLTGDQIYADDVSDIMLYMLMDAIGDAKITATTHSIDKLMGWSENLPGMDGINISTAPNNDILLPSQRTRLKEELFDNNVQIGFEKSGLTTGTHGSHLMKLGEYYGMYLFSFSDVLWPKDDITPLASEPDQPPVYPRGFPTLTDIYCGIDLNSAKKKNATLHAVMKKGSDEVKINKITHLAKYTKDRYNNQAELLSNFRLDLKTVRKVLANVPVYMILDDHEITDDYNLNKKWVETIGCYNLPNNGTVTGKPLGRRIIQNALTAYWLFQGWGNNPTYVNANFSTIFSQIETLSTSTNQIANFNTLGASLLPTLNEGSGDSLFPAGNGYANGEKDTYLSSDLEWHYTLRFHNKYQFLLLNTRTNRFFPKNKYGRGYAGLIGIDTINKQFKEAMTILDNEGHPITVPPSFLTFIISASPIFGSASLDKLSLASIWLYETILGKPFMKLLGQRKTREENDAEFWGFNKKCFEYLLNKISYFEHSVLLGGDVHFGLSRHITYWNNRAPYSHIDNTKISQMASFVSSALRNGGKSERDVVTIDQGHLPVSSWLHPKILPPNCNQDILGWPNNGEIVGLDTNGTPDLFTVHGKSDGTPATKVLTLREKQRFLWKTYKVSNESVERWSYRIRHVQDERLDGTRRQYADNNVSNSNIFSTSPAIPSVHAMDYKEGIEFIKHNLIVAPSNVAEVRITLDATTGIVSTAKQIFWFVPTNEDGADLNLYIEPYTIHEVNFSSNSDGLPTDEVTLGKPGEYAQ